MKTSTLAILLGGAVCLYTLILYAADPRVRGTAVVPRGAVESTAYNATTWDGNTNVPTKNALRDKIETLAPALNANQFTGGSIKSGALVTNLVGSSGSATTPDFATDPGTGIFKSATNSIGFATAGTERWAINASGALVAVGTVDIGNGLANPRDVNVDRQILLGTNILSFAGTNLLWNGGTVTVVYE